ncbi:cell division protein FtsW [Thalassotalea profundi]|uniref:Probable peptidoglycan glycosyltransferase FtsW n=1 Tax=Thalassotalea profundi TaxID=2036687 RepID=A0ABQ3IXU7_9GAMM|nr:cell division protein FtsW [Thalassotalea profundi]GHE95155.1 putative lipid II flippase FtsW [Thalassotalea profundi]
MISVASNFTWPTLKLSQWISPSHHSVSTFDRTYIVLAICMYMMGLVMVASSSMPIAERLFDNPFHFVVRHLIYICLSIIIAALTLQIPMAFWHKHSFKLLFLAMLLLLIVLLIGRTVNGSTRWIVIGPITIQAAEPAKLFLFCYLSAYMVRRRDEVMENVKGFIKPLIVFGVLAGLLLLQPDLGTVIVMFVTTFGLLFLAGAKLWQFISVAAVGLTAISALAYFSPYRWARVTSFLDPWKDPFGTGYQLTQSLMAYGRGEFLGQGLGNSIQKLEYLPEAHTDFVMAVVAEELGFAGIILVLVLSMTLVIKALLLGRKAINKEKYFEGFFAYSIAIWISFQAAVNVGASAGIVPTKGLTMPLISYGGSSMIIMTLAVVVLIRIDHEIRLQSIQATSSHSKNKRKKVGVNE